MVLCPTETGCGGTEPEAHQRDLGQALEGFSLIKPMVSGVVGVTKDSKPEATCVKRVYWWMNVFASAVRLNRRLARICLGLRLMEANADESIHVQCLRQLRASILDAFRVISKFTASTAKVRIVFATHATLSFKICLA